MNNSIEKQQVILIHGGEAWGNYEDYLRYLHACEVLDPNEGEEAPKKWKDNFAQNLGEGYRVIFPAMPSPQDAKYKEWKLWFEKYVPFLRDGVILIGNSLGGVFLAKYLAENTFAYKIKSLHLLAAPFGNRSCMSGTDFDLPESLAKITEQVGEVHLYHSKDDSVVPFGDFEAYAQALPTAKQHIFQNYDHFLIAEFPELVNEIINCEL